jgi:hypothetical protein
MRLRGKTIIFKNNRFSSGFQLVCCHIFKIEFVEMGKPAVPAPDREVPASDSKVVGTGDMAVPAFGRFDELPEVKTADFYELSFFGDVLDPGYENPGSPAIFACHLRLVRNCRNDLVGIFLTMVTVSAVPRDDEPVAHVR